MTMKRAVIEGGLDGKAEKRADSEAGPPGMSRKRAVLAEGVAPRPSEADVRAQHTPLHALRAEVRGLPSTVSDKNDEIVSNRAAIRELRVRFPAPTAAFISRPSGFLDEKAAIRTKPARLPPRTGRLTAQPAWPTSQPARFITQPARFTTRIKRFQTDLQPALDELRMHGHPVYIELSRPDWVCSFVTRHLKATEGVDVD